MDKSDVDVGKDEKECVGIEPSSTVSTDRKEKRNNITLSY